MMHPTRQCPRTTGKPRKAARKVAHLKQSAREVKGRGTVERSREMY